MNIRYKGQKKEGIDYNKVKMVAMWHCTKEYPSFFRKTFFTRLLGYYGIFRVRDGDIEMLEGRWGNIMEAADYFIKKYDAYDTDCLKRKILDEWRPCFLSTCKFCRENKDNTTHDDKCSCPECTRVNQLPMIYDVEIEVTFKGKKGLGTMTKDSSDGIETEYAFIAIDEVLNFAMGEVLFDTEKDLRNYVFKTLKGVYLI